MTASSNVQPTTLVVWAPALYIGSAHRLAVLPEDLGGGVEVCQVALVMEEGHASGHMEQHPGGQCQVQAVHNACTCSASVQM